ncbi:MAG: nucleoside triphosphate pyrophosphohydrolase [Flavobacteriales bacterium]
MASDERIKDKLQAFQRLLTIMDELREHCPWDREQTMESLRHLTIEEVHELGDAILDEDLPEVKKELGDIVLHVVFYSRIASEERAFDVADVLNAVCDKLVERHPHVYGDLSVSGEAEVKSNWEQIKQREGKQKRSVLEGVPRSLPAMVKAVRVQDKAAGVGFEWEKRDGALEKVREELNELEEEQKKGADKQALEEEFGDLLFALVNYSRYLGLDPDAALERANKKFIRRFEGVEMKAKKEGESLSELSLERLNLLWENVKKERRARE